MTKHESLRVEKWAARTRSSTHRSYLGGPAHLVWTEPIQHKQVTRGDFACPDARIPNCQNPPRTVKGVGWTQQEEALVGPAPKTNLRNIKRLIANGHLPHSQELRNLVNPSPGKSLIASSHVFLCLPHLMGAERLPSSSHLVFLNRAMTCHPSGPNTRPFRGGAEDSPDPLGLRFDQSYSLRIKGW